LDESRVTAFEPAKKFSVASWAKFAYLAKKHDAGEIHLVEPDGALVV